MIDLRCRPLHHSLFALGVFAGSLTAQATLPGDVEDSVTIGQFQGGFFGPIDAGDRFGASLTRIGDVDGDGIDDIAIGTPNANVGGTWRGGVWIMFLDEDATVRTWSRISSEDGGLVGLNDFDQFGFALSALGDVSGDGVPDIAVGAPGDDDSGLETGAVHVLHLTPEGTVGSQEKWDAAFLGIELDEFDAFGRSISSAGDIDGDGFDDLAIGAPLDDDGDSNVGALWIVFREADGSPREATKISMTTGGLRVQLDPIDLFASSVSSLGDVDGDGVPDLAVGAPNDSEDSLAHGAIYILLMLSDGRVRDTVKINHLEGGLDATLSAIDSFGTSLVGLGDFDNDTVPDLAVAALFDDDTASGTGVGHGAVYILSLEPSGHVRATRKISDVNPSFNGELKGVSGFGLAVATAGDLNGDGTVDLIVGADKAPGFGGQPKGAAWLLQLHAAEWTNIGGGFASPGSATQPRLEGVGTLVPESDVSLVVTTRAANAPIAVVLGAALASVPLGGGILGPTPDVVTFITTDAVGTASLAGRWPDVAHGTVFHVQALELGASTVIAATDTLSATSP